MNKHSALWIAFQTVLSLLAQTLFPVLANEERMSTIW
ncbi:hypothetical protein BACCIP111895_00256 [Neobacillus rhizosphaerae]|uniref:Uncharacterized protein n=1 Tax=Neobacillus rhizosphaerae TaxID=2880965 RepID=A0ABM9EKM2_9BACI|nr:hypothetical protein BACCIP111895_00256 [Neobacillus rhizosphaerae]